MTGDLYDVLVLGPVEATPSAEARLAAALAGRNGAPLTAVAQGLADGNLSVGQGLERAPAEALAVQLQSLGAITSIREAIAPAPPSGALTPTALGGFRTAGTPANGPLHGLGPRTAPGSGIKLGGLGQSPGSGLRPGGLEPSPSWGGVLSRAAPFTTSPGSSPGVAQGLRPLGSLRSETAPFPPAATPPPARIQTNGVGDRVPTGTGFSFNEPPSSRPPSTARAMAVADLVAPVRAAGAAPALAPDPFANPEAGATLELDRDRKLGESHRPSTSVAGASGLNVPKMTASKSASGLDLAGEKRSSIERCAKHGLLYDNRKSSACRKCLTDGLPAMSERPPGRLRASPARRALLGLLFGLVLGFLPAAYYSRQVGSAEVDRLRSEQKDLSSGLGSDTSIRRFEQIEELVAKSRQVNMRNTLIIWLAASGVLMVAWYRVT